MKRERERTDQVTHEFLVAVGVGAEVVIDVGDVQVELPAVEFRQFVQEAEEGDRIGPAADGQEEAVAGLDTATVLQGVIDGLDERFWLHVGMIRGWWRTWGNNRARWHVLFTVVEE